jgi:hypothetical protein
MDQPMADGQTETGAAESARGGGIWLGKASKMDLRLSAGIPMPVSRTMK